MPSHFRPEELKSGYDTYPVDPIQSLLKLIEVNKTEDELISSSVAEKRGLSGNDCLALVSLVLSWTNYSSSNSSSALFLLEFPIQAKHWTNTSRHFI